jgi:uncharacterized membrane protein YhiD involved in acid resistance
LKSRLNSRKKILLISLAVLTVVQILLLNFLDRLNKKLDEKRLNLERVNRDLKESFNIAKKTRYDYPIYNKDEAKYLVLKKLDELSKSCSLEILEIKESGLSITAKFKANMENPKSADVEKILSQINSTYPYVYINKFEITTSNDKVNLSLEGTVENGFSK